MHPEDEVVAARIREAWAHAEYPGDERLSGNPAICCGEYEYVAAFFRGRHWRDVTLESLQQYEGPANACCSFMSAEAFRFYLPAFMLIALEEPIEGARSHWEASMTDVAVWALDPPRYRPELETLEQALSPRLDVMSKQSQERLRVWWDQRAAGFTPPQVDAIVSFLARLNVRRGGDDKSTLDALAHWRHGSHG